MEALSENIIVGILAFSGVVVTAIFSFLGVLINARITRARGDIRELQDRVAELEEEKAELHSVNLALKAESRAWRRWAS